MYFGEMPRDVLEYILSFLNESDILFMSFTCKMLNHYKISVSAKCIVLEASKKGYLEILKWLKYNNCLHAPEFNRQAQKPIEDREHSYLWWDRQTCSYAILGGHFKVLRWLKENGCPWCAILDSKTLSNGHFKVITWVGSVVHFPTVHNMELSENERHGVSTSLKKIQCPWNNKERLRDYTWGSGYFNLMKWVREGGSYSNEYIDFYPSKNGYIDILKWLKESGCPWDEDTCAFISFELSNEWSNVEWGDKW